MRISKMSAVWLLNLSICSMSCLGLGAKASDINIFDIKSNRPHDVIVLSNGLASFEKRLEMIESATKSIDVEYFIYRTDVSSKIFTQALIKKARQGVKVRMILDSNLFTLDFTPFYTEELEKFGIEVKYFNPKGSFTSSQYRNHRKLLSVDGVAAITGGRNIGDEYFDLHEEYNFLDRDLYIRGELVKSMAKTFDEVFNAKATVRLEKDAKPKRFQYSGGRPGQRTGKPLGQYQADVKKWEAKVQAARDFMVTSVDNMDLIRNNGKDYLAGESDGICNSLSFQSEYPIIGKENRLNNRVIKYGLLERIKKAKKSILLESPYFIVDKELAGALDIALNHKNKVDVTLLTNSLNSTDAIYVYANFDSHINEWINKGLEPYIFKANKPANYPVIESIAGKARFGIHAKTFVFDDETIIIGTYNVDPRSANFNTEMIIACENSKELASVVKDDIQMRLDESFHLDSSADVKRLEFYETSFFKRIAYYMTKIPANVFAYLM